MAEIQDLGFKIPLVDVYANVPFTLLEEGESASIIILSFKERLRPD